MLTVSRLILPCNRIGTRTAARCCSRTMSKSAPGLRIRRLFCAPSAPNPGARRMCSHRAAPRTAVMARIQTGSSTIINIKACYLDSLKALGLDLTQNDVRFVEDDWENPTLGAWGLGWEVWLNGMEIT